MARRKATGATKAVGKAYWGAVDTKAGRAHSTVPALTQRCVRSGGPREACEDAARAGMKGRRPARPGKPWPRKSTAEQRSWRKEFGKASKACKKGGKQVRKACIRRKLKG